RDLVSFFCLEIGTRLRRRPDVFGRRSGASGAIEVSYQCCLSLAGPVALPTVVLNGVKMATYSGSMRCADASIGAHRHICAFFNGLDEEYRVLGSFYKDGFDRGEKATHIVEAGNREEYLKRLGEAGID